MGKKDNKRQNRYQGKPDQIEIDGENHEDENEEVDMDPLTLSSISTRIFLWEFGQNDPKRYSACLM